MARKEVPILETACFKTIERACSDTFKRSKLIGIIGEPGFGKTTALVEFALNHSNVFYIDAEYSQTSKQFFRKLLEVLGDSSNNDGLPLNYAINKAAVILNENSENKLIIIDQAGIFTEKMLLYLHEFRDKTKNYTGIVLVGPDYLQDNIEKMSAKGVIGIPELESRISKWQHIDRPTKNEKRAFCKAHGVKDNDQIESWVKKCRNFRQLMWEIEEYFYKIEDSQK